MGPPGRYAVLRPLAIESTRPVRVLHLLHTMAYGGIETSLLNWLRTIDRSRFEIHLFCFANPGGTEMPFIEAAQAQGWQVGRIAWKRRKPVWRAARSLAAEIRARGIDIVHCQNTYAQLVTVAAAQLQAVKTITTYHVWGDFGWKRNVLQWLDVKTSRWLDRISAQNEEAVAETIRRGIPADRVLYTPSGFDPSPVSFEGADRERRRRALGMAPGETALIYSARFYPEKAHEVALDGLRQILAQRPNVRLWMVGDGPERMRIEGLAERMGLGGHTHFLGFRKDVPELLALADVQIHPSDNEGVAIAVCEGMAAGLPIVASAVGGLPRVLRHERTALLIEPRRPDQLAAGVLRLLEQPELACALGTAARRFLEEEYSLRWATARLEAIYEEMLAPAQDVGAVAG